MSSSGPLLRGRRWRRIAAALAVLAAASATVWIMTHRIGTALPEGVSQDEYQSAERIFRDRFRRQPSRLDILSLAGELAVGDGRLETAAACFAAIPGEHRKYGPSARLQAGQVLLRLNRAREAEQNFREFLSLAEGHPSVSFEHVSAARKWLCFILSVELRLEERKAVLADLHADEQAGLFDSKQYYFPHLLLWHSSTGRRRLPEFLAQDPGNPQLRTAEGRYLTLEGRLAEARHWLEELHAERPGDLACTAALLELLFESDDWERFQAIAVSLPEYHSHEPWLLTRMRAESAAHAGEWVAAIEQSRRVLDVDPANPWCHMLLARAYAQLQRPVDREEEQRRSLVLSRIRVGLVNVTEDDYRPVLALASQCEDIGFLAAADTFRRHAQRIERASDERAAR
jgi:predicted Zn-dependent protease